ncbi:MAG: glycerol-3-phosphate 1-O-acyltransferase PlsY [Firmicutes bacterium]|nr:glycerol-3-phosphate 1-O-acyltransferase PlsY [Bacillota bacterium]
MTILWYTLALLASYLIGSVPSGWIVTRVWLGEDIRQFGSGNIGATNVLRTIGVVPAILVLLLDAAKGVVGVYLGGLVGEDFSRVLCGIAAIAGHNWSAYLGFRGGKGIATSAGVLFALWPHIGLILLGVFLLVVGITRYISLGSVTVAVIFPILLLLFRMPLRILLAGLVLSFFAVFRHSANIKRLWKGQEYKIGEKGRPRS